MSDDFSQKIVTKPDPSPQKMADKPDHSLQKPKTDPSPKKILPQTLPKRNIQLSTVKVKSEPMDSYAPPGNSVGNSGIAASPTDTNGSSIPKDKYPIKIKPIASLMKSSAAVTDGEKNKNLQKTSVTERKPYKYEPAFVNNGNQITIKTEPIEAMEHEPFGASISRNESRSTNHVDKRSLEVEGVNDSNANTVAKKACLSVQAANGVSHHGIKSERSGTVVSAEVPTDGALIVRQPSIYSVPSVHQLEVATKYIFRYIDLNDPTFRKDLKRDDDYESLCQYLAKDQVQLLCERNHSKNLLWDIYIRYCLINLQSRIKIYDYTSIIESSFNTHTIIQLLTEFNNFHQRKTAT